MTIVRDNLMSRPGYAPYCGNGQHCTLGMPRTHFINGQFECGCGWRSNFDGEFIAEYKAKWKLDQSSEPTAPRASSPTSNTGLG